MVFFRTPRVAVEPSREYLNDLELRLRETFNRISTQPVSGGGGGITKLSQLEIDDDKDWADRSINHLHSILIQPDMLPAGELDTIFVQHSDKVFKTLFNVFRDDMNISHTQNFLNFILGDYDLLLGIEHIYSRTPLPLDRYYAVMGADNLDTLFNMKSLSVNAYDGFAVYGNYIYLDTPDLEFVLSSNAELTFYGENQNAIISGRSENLFRIQDMGDTEKHVVDSIYHDDTLNLDIVGTRWAMKVGNNDYHLAIGQSYDVANGIMHTGILSSHSLEIEAITGDIVLSPGSYFIKLSNVGNVDYTDVTVGADYDYHFINFYRYGNSKGICIYVHGTENDTIFNTVEIHTSTIYQGEAYYGSLFFSEAVLMHAQNKRFVALESENPFRPRQEFPPDSSYILLDREQNISIVANNNLLQSGSEIDITSTSGDITLNPASAVDFSNKQSKNHVLQHWTTSTRPTSPIAGQVGFNTDTGQFEGWNGSTWVILG
jgi:hypothetical protein